MCPTGRTRSVYVFASCSIEASMCMFRASNGQVGMVFAWSCLNMDTVAIVGDCNTAGHTTMRGPMVLLLPDER